jgi:hypothetical protein
MLEQAEQLTLAQWLSMSWKNRAAAQQRRT